MKVLVTGAKGQLGFDCVRVFKKCGFKDVLGIDVEDVDITQESKIKNFIFNYRPDVVVHCASYTAVNQAEVNKEIAYKVNVLGTKYIAESAEEINAKLVYISTDYVFDGSGSDYHEVADKTNPLNYYGYTKLEGEKSAGTCSKSFIIRISWAFGIKGNNFIKAMLTLADNHKELVVVNDQIGSPTYTYDLAKLISVMLTTDKYGTYHATNEGVCSWCELADATFKLANKDTKVIPMSSKEYQLKHPGTVNRPHNSKLSKKSLDSAGFKRLPSWQDALKRYLKELKVI